MAVIRIVFRFGLLAVFCFGVYDVLKNYENNACEMTYMFEMPDYMVRNDES